MHPLLQQIHPRMLAILMLAVLGMTVLAAYLYLFKQPYTDYAQLRTVRVQAVEDVASVQQDMESGQIALLERHVAGLEDRLYGKGSRLPPSQMVSYIIGQLDRISVRHAVQLMSVKPGGVEQVLMFEEVPFDIQVQGAYFDLFAWLEDMERELRPMVLKKFEITPPRKDGALNMQLRLVSYRSVEAGA